jgi:hypothetical protein
LLTPLLLKEKGPGDEVRIRRRSFKGPGDEVD